MTVAVNEQDLDYSRKLTCTCASSRRSWGGAEGGRRGSEGGGLGWRRKVVKGAMYDSNPIKTSEYTWFPGYSK